MEIDSNQTPNGVPRPDETDAESGEDKQEPTVADLERERAELEDRWRRALADLDNLRKRYARESERARASEKASVTSQWLPILDSLELALEHAEADPAAIVEGVRAVRDQAVDVLTRLGYPQRGQVGEPFNAADHEVVGTVPDETHPPGTVVHVVRPGYGVGSDQLRPAAVIVSTTGP